MASRTSCVDFISSIHGEQRRIERQITKRNLQAAVKYGLKENTFPHPRTGENRLKFTYDDIVYITDATATTEVTSWSLRQLPLEKTDIDASLVRQITEQKRRLSTASAAVMSHSVLIVDQSGSMKKSDVCGHRTRSRGAYYTIANEMIAQPLLRDQISFTDLLSVIEMRDNAIVTLFKEPITWELHNRIVELANNPFSPRGNGNYLPALEKAVTVLNTTLDLNCALLLMILSDGGPSDHCTRFRHYVGNSQNLARDAILTQVRQICQPLKDRLTFGAFGFASDVLLGKSGQKTFDLLRSMASMAEAAGSKAVFSCGLDTDSIRKALYTMATSLLLTRTNLSSLAGGSLLRVTTKKVKRTDLEKAGSGSCYHYHRVKEDGLRRVVSRTTYDKVNKKLRIEWDYVKLLHPLAEGITVKTGFIDQGAERAAYEMTEVGKVDKFNQPVGQLLVGKVSIHEEPSQIDFHKHCAATQFEAGRLASLFNEILNDLRIPGITIPHIEFLPVWFYEWWDKDETVIKALLCEKRLDSERYKKWNDNRGGVFNLNRCLEEDQADDDDDDGGNMRFAEDAGEESSSSSSSSSSAAAAAAVSLADAASRIIDEDVPQAFSHWSNQYTKGHSLVCDMQGVLGTSFQLTDPAIHSSKRRFGSTDFGRKGMHKFYSTHECNPLCKVLRLKPPVPYRQAEYKRSAGNQAAAQNPPPSRIVKRF